MRIGRQLEERLYRWLDQQYVRRDQAHVLRTRNLRRVPPLEYRQRGGKIAYGEWCHVIGIFQTLLYQHLAQPTDNRILDVGCGTGLIAIASEPFLGEYIGLDVSQADIDFCRMHYPFEFQHVPQHHAIYAPDQTQSPQAWQIADNSIDMLTALSVWTHFNEAEARFYFQEVQRVLKVGGQAILTCFYLDAQPPPIQTSRFHNTSPAQWIFDVPCSESGYWLHPAWVTVPENAIGIHPSGVDLMLAETTLQLKTLYTGNWKEKPGLFFQDILVLEKTA